MFGKVTPNGRFETNTRLCLSMHGDSGNMEIWNMFFEVCPFCMCSLRCDLKKPPPSAFAFKSHRSKTSTFSTMATRSMRPVLLPLALLAAIAAPAFTGMSRATPRTRIPRAADNFIPLDAIEPAVSSYVYLGLHSESQLSKLLRKILREWIDEVSMCFLNPCGPCSTFLEFFGDVYFEKRARLKCP